ncbi:MAG TPA: class I SAM-dependent methyltransferase [Longimicrobiales bacterium]
MATLQELRRYYQRRYAAPPGAMRDYRSYLDLIDAEPGSRILDVGCGEGFFLEEAIRGGLAAVGVEIVQPALRLARQRIGGGKLAAAAGEALPFADASMDFVACLGSLEHFAQPAAGAQEVARVLRPDGQAMIAVPNRQFLGWLFLRRQGTEQQEVAELLLDRQGWIDLLTAAGLEVVAISKEPWHTKPFPSVLKRIVVRAAWHLIPLRWTYQFVIRCRRPPCHSV